MSSETLWQRYRRYTFDDRELGLRLDISRMGFGEAFFPGMATAMERVFRSMAVLEAGAVANPDEGRQVGHYWLRAPELAPSEEQTLAIRAAQEAAKDFAAKIHGRELHPPGEERFTDLLVIGIGGSALGPQLAADALGQPGEDRLLLAFFDNTDPDGMARTLAELGDRLATTLCVVISKSGGTPETRNGLLVAQRAMADAGLDFAPRAVAITGEGSALDQRAEEEGWLARFPMWDWVGGRTSVTSAVGLVPAALQGLDVDAFLAGAAACDACTRVPQVAKNPAALLALMWFHATQGQGERDMVILPYRDRLLLFSRYLQQLVMESLGKGEDLQGRPVAQGIAVYGNKGSTDQHAFVQQLREGVDNFFVTFIEVLANDSEDPEVEPGVTCSDYLRGFLLGTREALRDGGRQSMTVTVDCLDARTLGILVALYERAVGFYASLVGINAYHQPGVEAGKRAAAGVLALQRQVLAHLEATTVPRTAEQISVALGEPDAVETIFHLLEGLAANGRVEKAVGEDPFGAGYSLG
jgi:glucose-6-phosphate isomerase